MINPPLDQGQGPGTSVSWPVALRGQPPKQHWLCMCVPTKGRKHGKSGGGVGRSGRHGGSGIGHSSRTAMAPCGVPSCTSLSWYLPIHPPWRPLCQALYARSMRSSRLQVSSCSHNLASGAVTVSTDPWTLPGAPFDTEPFTQARPISCFVTGTMPPPFALDSS